MAGTTTMSHIVTGLKSRHEDVRNRTAQDLKKYVTTELREVSADELTNFMDEFNHHIFEMVSSSDVHEKKGGILAIGKELNLILLELKAFLATLLLITPSSFLYTVLNSQYRYSNWR